MSDKSPFERVEIKVGANGVGKVVIDGKDISNLVDGVNVRIRAGQLTSIFLRLRADVEISADAEVRK